MGGPLLGRDTELAAARAWLDRRHAGPRLLMISGEAGMGKTALWTAALSAARSGHGRVLACRPGEAETGLIYSGLGDLLDGQEDSPAVRGLPEPLRAALGVALLWRAPGETPPDQRAVALAVLHLLRRYAADGPPIIAVDDLQWLDPSTEAVLSFALRRLDQPAGVLATLRTGAGDLSWPPLARAVPPDRVERHELGPLDRDAVGAVLASRYGRPPRPGLLRVVHEASGGNPLFALELARTLGDRPDPEADLPVPEGLRHLLRTTIDGLSDAAAEVALMLASASRVQAGLLDGLPARHAGLAELVARHVVTDDPVPRFTNPLYGAAVLESAGAARRREMHARLARTAAGPEERARHLALAATGPDAAAADALHEAARLAVARGAPYTAGELAEWAARLTPSEQDELATRRRIEAAANLLTSGGASRARALLEDVAERCPSGPVKAEVLFLLNRAIFSEGDHAGALVPNQQARLEAGDSVELLVPILADLAYSRMHVGHLAGAAGHARELLALATRVGDAALRDEATIAMITIEFMRTARPPAEVPEPGYDNPLDRSPFAALHVAGYLYRSLGDLPAARAALDTVRTAAVAAGIEAYIPSALMWATEVECLAGDLDAAAERAALARRAGQEAGTPSTSALFTEALVLAHRGEPDRARPIAEEGLAVALRFGLGTSALCLRALLGFVELAAGDPAEAVRHLEAMEQAATSLGAALEVVCPTAVSDHVAALVALGRLDRAAELADRAARSARLIDRPLARGVAGRARGLLLTATGAPKRAAGELGAACAEFTTAGMPFELARTLLALAQAQGRLRQRAAARRSAERAAELFAELGAPGWAATAAQPARPAEPYGLTPSEARVAALAARGRSNREIAEELVIEVKTVETHLSSAYRKLGVRGRTQLAVRFGEDAGAGRA
ncbi:LuxR family transcriptional regulator [Actinomadura sp. ATCC 31491]|uniref:LuxR family transcriptional regulator n=1 Tax=Actinomadura luzonensis TaxID=2805427 RepID=A0ABT0FM24_9ACTN|nr:LuxR family transcriptional regulator [Actinomadura luzonensis]MCK2213395.1 LuxR family transcriptional regulator [Actinomadura luzonensis]